MIIQKIPVIIIFILLLLINIPTVLADAEPCDTAQPATCDPTKYCEPTLPGGKSGTCQPLEGEIGPCNTDLTPNGGCQQPLHCEPTLPGGKSGTCQPSVAPAAPAVTSGIGKIFGSISPPPSLSKFIAGDPSGAKGIGNFLSNLILLIYIFATIALLFMLLWGAFDWITSEGEKEKINAARGKIINAIIGLMLFAVAFAFLRVLGTFTGFKFFVGQDTASLGQVCCARTYTREGDRCYLLKEDGPRLYDNPVARCPDGTYCSSYDPATRQPTCINP